jgi:hypothetical protein
MLQKYGKTAIAALFAFITAIQALVSDGNVTQQEGVQIAIAFFTAISVYFVPMIGYPAAKTIVAVILAVLNVLTTAIIGGLDAGDLTGMLLAALTAVGVAGAPARSDPPRPVSDFSSGTADL